MATPDPFLLRPLPRARLGDVARLLPASGTSLSVAIVEPLRVVTLRCLPGGQPALAAAVAAVGAVGNLGAVGATAANFPAATRVVNASIAAAGATAGLPGPGRFIGVDPLLAWRGPGEWLHFSRTDAPADALLAALPPGDAPAQAIDLSAGTLVVELQGPALDALIARLFDATVRLAEPGQGTRTRLAEIAVVALRLAPRRLWLLVDRANDDYLARWLTYAADADLSPQP
ncbi:hypothetical protein [Mitsuaria sp. GD03876]|uniref:hypothetical protein n=1 Tax=Mitsuaria sp. GD03876 TaxID=2975399 RepID=UPI00244AB0DD|nr:hypothetical protein [Mitsuaria sp. GD03876]MDH0866262.1 hypothetical protein [Mitsuaria sp. GD03876]